MSDLIYLDNAATTRTKPEVVEKMLPYFTENFGNPSAIYDFAARNKKAINDSRQIVAKALNADMRDIYFTSGGTESDNWALVAIAENYASKGKHIITTKIEHHAVLHTCQYLEKQRGFEVTYLDVDESGILDISKLESAIRPDTILISVMFANNEIGTIQPISEIGALARERDIVFHTDAVQAFGHVPIDVESMNIDLLSASGHKFGGPKGVGILYARNGINIKSFMHGGAQERNRRPGTENVPAIVGLGEAVRIATSHMAENAEKTRKVRDYIIDDILSDVDHCTLNGHREKRLPNNINMSFNFIEGESLLIMLDMEGICASSGSACTSGAVEPSHVLQAIGLSEEMAKGSVRMTLDENISLEDAKKVCNKLKEIINRLRSMSPAYKNM
ncbi:MAG: cysteine desulfurase NifS [Eubacterium sp.]|nr:cysteine desulfurase NifS [Eubacterium sp.]